PSYFPDWFPTLCDAVGIAQPEGLDGDSLWPVLTGKQPTLENRRPLVWAFPGYGGQVAVRIGDHKVVRQQLRTPMPGPWEVYNLATDRSEANDIAARHPELIAQANEIFRREVADHAVSPIMIPGVN